MLARRIVSEGVRVAIPDAGGTPTDFIDWLGALLPSDGANKG